MIVLREAFEASLVIGLILAFLTKTGRRSEHESTVWQGVAAAIAVSVAMGALLFATVGELEGTAEALYEGFAMLLACVVLTWMVFWMRRQAATIGGDLRAKVGAAVGTGGGLALASVAFIAVAREGLETALFLFVSVGDSGLVQTIAGGTLGLAAALVLGVLFYRGSVRLDLRRFFLVTGLLVIAFAAYLLYGGLHELGEAGGGEHAEVLDVARVQQPVDRLGARDAGA
ncbi:MAG TPA: FTR1 family protein, partial [Solirubrobacteraceae bacterium]|nr:FTR1 family protein [Solirubrobacteraceae bacterium]